MKRVISKLPPTPKKQFLFFKSNVMTTKNKHNQKYAQYTRLDLANCDQCAANPLKKPT